MVSLIVPTFKREEELVETLQSLLTIEFPSWELIVVDQTEQHQPATEAFLKKLEAEQKIRWFRPPQVNFTSLTRARNFGIAQANNPEFIVFVDDDVEVVPNFLSEHVAAYADPSVGATVGKVTVPGTVYPSYIPRIGYITWMGAFIDNFHASTPAFVDNFIGCNHSLRVSLLPKIGLYDENFRGNALREDSDMAMRVRALGQKIAFLPTAAVIHKQAQTGGTRSQKSRLEWYESLFYNNFLFYAKHYPAWRLPFFVLHMWRPILACWLYYGKGRPSALYISWKGIVEGYKVAKKSISVLSGNQKGNGL